MKPQTVPSAPTDVQINVQSGSSLRVFFSNGDNGGDVISKYRVEYDTTSNFDSTLDNSILASCPNRVDGTRSCYKDHLYLDGGAPFAVLLPNLEMGTFYYVRVKAYNSNGFGAATQSSPVREKPMQPPTAPTRVQLFTTSNSMLTVAWEPPSNIGGDETKYYKVDWDRQSGFNSEFSPPHRGSAMVSASNHGSYTIEGLTAGVTYYARVSARNQMGEGPSLMTSPGSS